MEAVLHKSETRGKVDYGWLKSKHTFSFGSYTDESRIHFGALRVLNDDTIAGGTGFPMHPHQDMEIITIPLEGAVEHKDSIGTNGVIRAGEVQVMSAGTGILHSEFNHSASEPLSLLQIWVIPEKRSVSPRYAQKTYSVEERKNRFQVVVSPDQNSESLWIHQNAWFSLGNLDAGVRLEYERKNKKGGVYAFLIGGKVQINGVDLLPRDGAGFALDDVLEVKALEDSELLLMDVPEL
ncbi:pirin family protein [Leptospira fluminis]|uniref:Pirin family protein n=1 Tax=Leptospira fluminis TaxID=2484979 RepID=A0A4R9GT88_9LEPT|nr:pirin family protein [Leptospira fluminis]TGK22004.1 pirin family protein [Leptospira fluminis]